MALQGYIKLYRQIQDHWLYQENRPFTRREAWEDLLLNVNHKENRVPWGSKFITVGPGQRITSIRKLCDRWKWSNTKVKAFLEILKDDNMIAYKSDAKKTLITVVNWERYQGADDAETPQKRHKNVTKTSLKHTNKNEENEENEKNEKYIFSPEIQEFRSRYSEEQLKIIDQYFEILRTTRISGKIADSVLLGVYRDMNRFNPLVVEYACRTVVKKPDLHAKKENYFVGILRHTTMEEATKGLKEAANAKPPVKKETSEWQKEADRWKTI